MLLQDRLKNRANNLDALRFALSCAVVFTHSFNLTGRVAWEPLSRLTGGQTAAATLAVNFFFLISGLLIAQSWERSDGMGSYLLKRVLRIYPAFIVAVVLTLVVCSLFAEQGVGAYFHNWRTYTFVPRQLLFHKDPLLYGCFKGSGTPDLPLGSLATLRYEVACYVMVPLIAWAGAARSKWLFLAAMLVSLGAFMVAPDLGKHLALPFFGTLSYVPRVFVYFLIGSVAFYFREHVPLSAGYACIAAGGLVAASLLGRLNMAMPVLGSYLLLYVAFMPAGRLARFGAYGDFSYGIFIYGYLVQQVLVALFHSVITPTRLTLLSLPITLGIAVMSWVFVEHPCLNLKKTLAGRRSRSRGPDALGAPMLAVAGAGA